MLDLLELVPCFVPKSHMTCQFRELLLSRYASQYQQTSQSGAFLFQLISFRLAAQFEFLALLRQGLLVTQLLSRLLQLAN